MASTSAPISALTDQQLRDLLELAEGGRPDGMGIKNKWIVRLIEEVNMHRAAKSG